MRYVFLGLVMFLIGAVIAGMGVFSPPPSPEPVTNTVTLAPGVASLELNSYPFPMAVGQSSLIVTLTGTNGAPVDGGFVAVEGTLLNHGGMIPMRGQTSASLEGEYTVNVTWPMSGQWLIDVFAELPDGSTLEEQYEVFIYAVRPLTFSENTRFRSVRENEEAISANPEREMWIVIPQGTNTLLRHGHAMMPDELRLSLSGQNTLVIRNDDIVEHEVGPFFIRPGETVRQQFTRAALFEGVCSISTTGSISIIVEG